MLCVTEAEKQLIFNGGFFSSSEKMQFTTSVAKLVIRLRQYYFILELTNWKTKVIAHLKRESGVWEYK